MAVIRCPTAEMLLGAPLWLQHCQLLWGGGKHAHGLHSKKHPMPRLSVEPFLLISTPRQPGCVSAGCQPRWHLPNGKETRGSGQRESQATRSQPANVAGMTAKLQANEAHEHPWAWRHLC